MTLLGATLGGRQRSRLSIGARALGTPPDPTQLPRALHAAPPTPPLPAPHPSSARTGPQPAALPQGSQEAPEVPLRGLSVPYTQRLQTAGCFILFIISIPAYTSCTSCRSLHHMPYCNTTDGLVKCGAILPACIPFKSHKINDIFIQV